MGVFAAVCTAYFTGTPAVPGAINTGDIILISKNVRFLHCFIYIKGFVCVMVRDVAASDVIHLLLAAALHRQNITSSYGYSNTLRTGLLNCLNARSRGLTCRHRASCI